MTRTFTALALALSATSALAQDYNRQDLVRGLCQKDGCDEFTILAADRIRATDEGTLFKTRLKTFHASHAGRKDRGEENGYVFCSPTRPAIMAEQNGQTDGLLSGSVCDPGEPGERAQERQLPCPVFCDLPWPGGREGGSSQPRRAWPRAKAIVWRWPIPSSCR